MKNQKILSGISVARWENDPETADGFVAEFSSADLAADAQKKLRARGVDVSVSDDHAEHADLRARRWWVWVIATKSSSETPA